MNIQLFKIPEGVVVGFRNIAWALPIQTKLGTPLPPHFWAEKGGIFKSCPSDMTSKGLWEMFECDSADMCAENFPLVSMGGRAEGIACAEPEARTPIDASGNYDCF